MRVGRIDGNLRKCGRNYQEKTAYENAQTLHIPFKQQGKVAQIHKRGLMPLEVTEILQRPKNSIDRLVTITDMHFKPRC